MNPSKLPTARLALLGALPLLCSPLQAALIVTYAENPQAVTSSLPNTTRFSFNNLNVGQRNTNVPWYKTSNGNQVLVGTFDQVYVQGQNAFGGAIDVGFASGSPYAVQSATVGGAQAVPTTTLTLAEPNAYFGLWWSAGDATNELTFYLGNSLVARFTTASLLNRLAGDASYKGNPRNRNEAKTESFAFINFFGDEGTTWDKIVLSNSPSSTSGFEADNYTSRVAPWTPADGPRPGITLATVTGTTVTTIPEPSALLLTLGTTALVGMRRRRK